ncbi:hypothetical protein TWF281_003146 [Arthrobotrys megalospora]
MRSLATLVAVPEVFDEILEYFDTADLFSLILTCKLLYPVCHKHLWSTLRLYLSDGGGFNGLFSNKWEKKCQKLCEILHTRRFDTTGLKDVRKLVLGRKSLSPGNEFISTGLAGEIRSFLASGSLDPNHLELRYTPMSEDDNESGNEVASEGREDIRQFYATLRDYTSQKSTNRFSFVVGADFNTGMLKTLAIEKITSLELLVTWPRDWEHRSKPPDDLYTAADGYPYPEPYPPPNSYNRREVTGNYQMDTAQWNKSLATDFIELLSRGINLGLLTIKVHYKAYMFHPDLKPQQHLADLKDAFRNHPRLHTLEIGGNFFHQSLFIAPPASARTVAYYGNFSSSWLQQFKDCPFTGVTKLSVVHCETNTESIPGYRKDMFMLPCAKRLEDVKFTGLNICTLREMSWVVDDIEECILRRNKRLNKISRQMLLDNIRPSMMKGGQERMISATQNYLALLKDDYTRNPVPKDDDTRQKAVDTATERCLKEMTKEVDKVDSWKEADARARAFSARCGEKIRDLLQRFEAQLTLDYTQKIMGGLEEPDEDVDRVSKNALQWMMDNMETHEKWSLASQDAEELSNLSRKKVEEKIEECVHCLGHDDDLVEASNSLGEAGAVEEFTKKCAEKIGTTDYKIMGGALPEPVKPAEAWCG